MVVEREARCLAFSCSVRTHVLQTTKKESHAMTRLYFLAGAAALGLCTPVAAAPFHHHHGYAMHHGYGTAIAARHGRGRAYDERVVHASQEPLGSGQVNPYANYNGPGSAVLNATVRAAGEPGMTLELAPDAKETATGGPVGGPPGFDGS